MSLLSTHKVEIRKGLGTGDWRAHNQVIFEVSLDNRRFTGDHLGSILHWAESKFQIAHIIICDTLQRHNLRFYEGVSAATARKHAQISGDAWLMENNDLFLKTPMIVQVHRWDQWKKPSSAYRKELNALKRVYNTNNTFRNEINDYLETVWKQKSTAQKLNSKARVFYIETVLKPYFFEETAITSVFLNQLDGISAYPGSLPPIWESLIQGKYDVLKGFRGHTFLQLDLSRRKAIA